MTKYPSFAAMIAATALIALPVLAQTTPGSGTSNSPALSSPGSSTVTRPVGNPASTTSPTMSSSTTSSLKYFTADHQIRVSKVVGSSVYDEHNQSIGSVDDVLMGDADHKAGTAVLSVGGFLGMGSKLVSVPFDQLKIDNDKIVLPGATKASLESMPDFRYNA